MNASTLVYLSLQGQGLSLIKEPQFESSFAHRHDTTVKVTKNDVFTGVLYGRIITEVKKFTI
jgi:hypothetical protein